VSDGLTAFDRWLNRVAVWLEQFDEPAKTAAYRSGSRTGRLLVRVERYRLWWLREFRRGLEETMNG